MDSLASILKTVGSAAHLLLEPAIPVLPTLASQPNRCPHAGDEDDDDYDDDADDLWLLQKRRRLPCKRQATQPPPASNITATNSGIVDDDKLLTLPTQTTGDIATVNSLKQQHQTPSPAAITDDCDDSAARTDITQCEPTEAVPIVPSVVVDDLMRLLGIELQPLQLGLALLTSGADETPARVAHRCGASEQDALMALDELCRYS